MKNESDKADPTQLTSIKKVWADPELIMISKGGLESGTKHTLHEKHFTPNIPTIISHTELQFRLWRQSLVLIGRKGTQIGVG